MASLEAHLQPDNPARQLLRHPIPHIVVAAIILLMVAPGLPAYWAGLSHFGQISDQGAGEHGAVTVESCQRGSLIVEWTCTGTFAVNDPMAEPYPPPPDVRLANDYRWHRTGSQVDASISVGGHTAYRWGGGIQIETVLYWIAVLLSLVALARGVAAATRRSRIKARAWLWLPAVGLLFGLSIVGPTGLLPQQGGPEPPPSPAQPATTQTVPGSS